jgi:isopentenyl phosphate kinase
MIFLKLGGSLLTEKDKPSTLRADVLQRAAEEIAAARAADRSLRLLLGHGSGSFGHFPAKQHGTRAGVSSPAQWRGFIEVWQQAAALNHLVMAALHGASLPALAFPPSAAVSAADGTIAAWNLQPIHAALDAGLLPVVFGDVALDSVRGSTILSTEDLFVHLAQHLKPSRILLAGDQDGVLANYPFSPQLIPEITTSTADQVWSPVPRESRIGTPEAGASSAPADVTGGMAGKVQAMLALVQQLPSCEIRIFSGLVPGNIQKALAGAPLGTLLKKT